MKIRPITDRDWPRLQDFVRRHFGFSHIPDRRFHEHWFRNPFGPGPEGETWGGRLLERPDGSLAGALLVILLPGWFAGRRTRIAYLSTGVVEEDARAKGQGAALYLWAYRSFPLVLAMAGNELSAPLNALMGQDIPGVAMRRFLRLNRPEALDLCKADARPDVAIVPPGVLPTGLSAQCLDDLPEDYDALWRDVRQTLVCAVDKSADYLRWRCRAPYTDYRILAVRRADALIGLAVCRSQETPPGPVVRVTDMIARPADAAAVWSAVADATREALLTDFLVVGTLQDKALSEAGFSLATAENGLDQVPHLLSPVEHRQWTSVFTLGGALAQGDETWRAAEAVYFTKGDGDRDWPTLYDLERLEGASRAIAS